MKHALNTTAATETSICAQESYVTSILGMSFGS